jgi:chemotaxis protein methyltransferase CheR
MNLGAFEFLRAFLRARAGLAIEADKRDLIEARLAPVARREKDLSVDALLDRLEHRPCADLERSVLEAMVTNETFFFRDRLPFDQLRAVLLDLMKRRDSHRHIRIWSAACSTGQEPYSLAMVLDEMGRSLSGWRVDIVATDISESALTVARNGLYNQFEVQRGLPVTHLLRYFRQEGDRWRIAEHIQTRVCFKSFNLMIDPVELGWFDIIFCRNVLIYFDLAARRAVLERLAHVLSDDGALVLGAAETVIGVTDQFERVPDHPMLWSRRPSARDRRPLRLVANV